MRPAIHTDREAARDYFTRTIEHERRCLADPHDFASFPRSAVITHCEWGLRWLDCAPAGANFLLAPLQDKRGVPCGGAWSENVGAQRRIREARARHGRNPFSDTLTREA